MGMATEPRAAAGHARRADRAAAGGLGRGAADWRRHVLHVGHRGLDRDVGLASRRRWREALVRHDELIADCVEAHGGRFLKSMGEGDSTVSVFDSAPSALAAARCGHACAVRRARGRAACDVAVALRPPHRRGGASRDRLLRPAVNLAARLRGQADGGQIFLSSVTADLVARHLPDGLRARRPRPASSRGGAGARSESTPSRPPGVSAPLPATRVPVPRTARVRGRGPRLLLRPRRGRHGADRAAGARHGCSRWSARRGAASRRCCAPGSSLRCRRARSRNQHGALLHARARSRASTSTTTPPSCSSSTSSRSCSRSATDADLRTDVHRRAAGAATRPVVIGDASRHVRPARRLSASSPARSPQPAPARGDERRRARAGGRWSPHAWPGCDSSRAGRAGRARRGRRARRAAAALPRAARHVGATRRPHAHRRGLPRERGRRVGDRANGGRAVPVAAAGAARS